MLVMFVGSTAGIVAGLDGCSCCGEGDRDCGSSVAGTASNTFLTVQVSEDHVHNGLRKQIIFSIYVGIFYITNMNSGLQSCMSVKDVWSVLSPYVTNFNNFFLG